MHPVSIVVLTYNRRQRVLHTLALLRALPDGCPIVVVDNGSTDGTAAAIRRACPDVQVIALSRNCGAAGRNAGVRAAHTPYVAFCDDDTWWAPGSLSRAATMLDGHPRIALLCARVLVGTERREDPVCAEMAHSPLGAACLPGASILGFLAGASVVRRSAFLEAGGYEPRLFLGSEEDLLALDLAARGWLLVYCEALTVHHAPAPRGNVGRRRRLCIRNAVWVAWLRRPLASAWRETTRALAEAHGPAELLACCLAIVKGAAWVLRHRRVIPPQLEAQRARIDRMRLHDACSPAPPEPIERDARAL